MQLLLTDARRFHSLHLLQPYLSAALFTLLTASMSSDPAAAPFPLYTAHLHVLDPSLASASSTFVSTVPPPLPIKPSAAALAAAAKKRGKPSQGVAKLAKADTKGMSKISSFFKPKAAASGTSK